MAKAQRQPVNALTVWTILFVALWLGTTVVLVILYTGQEELRIEKDGFADRNAKLISQSESRSIELVKRARKGGPTVVGLLWEERTQTAELATGEPQDDAGAVQAKLEQSLGAIRDGGIVADPERFDGVSYHVALNTLYKSFTTQHAQWLQMEDRLAELDAEVGRLIAANTQQQDDLDARLRETRDQFTEVEVDRTRIRTESEARVAELEQQFDSRRQQSEEDLTQERQQTSVLREELKRLEERIHAYQKKLGEQLPGPKKLATVRKPDGEVLTAVAGDRVVYINLGRNDRLILGLDFAVYAAGTGIPADGRAKARIKVVAISPVSAECEIVHVRGSEIISPGDLIANPVFDPKRSVSFLVLGQFDLNHDGVVDPDGVATIESMITNWGGEVLTEMSGLTDFVVVGAAPRHPRRGAGQSPERTAGNQAMESSRQQYEDTLRWARTLSVPILTQEIFLSFLGYSG